MRHFFLLRLHQNTKLQPENIFKTKIYCENPNACPQIPVMKLPASDPLHPKPVKPLCQQKTKVDKNKIRNKWVIPERAQKMSVKQRRQCPCPAAARTVNSKNSAEKTGNCRKKIAQNTLIQHCQCYCRCQCCQSDSKQFIFQSV